MLLMNIFLLQTLQTLGHALCFTQATSMSTSTHLQVSCRFSEVFHGRILLNDYSVAFYD